LGFTVSSSCRLSVCLLLQSSFLLLFLLPLLVSDNDCFALFPTGSWGAAIARFPSRSWSPPLEGDPAEGQAVFLLPSLLLEIAGTANGGRLRPVNA
jgi:hypothetical protein